MKAVGGIAEGISWKKIRNDTKINRTKERSRFYIMRLLEGGWNDTKHTSMFIVIILFHKIIVLSVNYSTISKINGIISSVTYRES
jgi:hypothetical protein